MNWLLAAGLILAPFTVGASLASAVGVYALMKWLTPKTPSMSPQQLQTPPTTKQGTPIRIAFGRQHQENSNLVDYGNVQSFPIRAKGGKK